MNVCDICGEVLDEHEAFQVSLTGEGVHTACVELLEEEEDDDRERTRAAR